MFAPDGVDDTKIKPVGVGVTLAVGVTSGVAVGSTVGVGVDFAPKQ